MAKKDSRKRNESGTQTAKKKLKRETEEEAKKLPKISAFFSKTSKFCLMVKYALCNLNIMLDSIPCCS